MNTETIERWAEDVLTVCVVSKDGAEHDVWVLLRHLFSAVKMHDNMEQEDRQKVAQVIKIAKRMFASNFTLRTKRARSPRKEKFPPHPLKIENTPLTSKGERMCVCAERKISKSVEERREAFKKECLAYVDKYDNDRLRDFFNYFSEENRRGTKMRFESERYWNTGKRLELWMGNQYSSATTNAAIRLQKTQKKQTEKEKEVELQKKVVEIRTQEDARREEERQEAKKNAVSYEEWLAMKAAQEEQNT